MRSEESTEYSMISQVNHQELLSLNKESNSKNAVFMRFLRLFNNDLITK